MLNDELRCHREEVEDRRGDLREVPCGNRFPEIATSIFCENLLAMTGILKKTNRSNS